MNKNNTQKNGEKNAKVFNNQWILKKKVSSGSFGVVFIGQDKNTKELVAIKLEKEDNEEIRSLDREVQIFKKLQGLPQIPKLYWNGIESNYNIMVLSLLGRDLAHFMKVQKKLSLKTVLMLFDQLIPILENIHNRSVIHRDLKPENILMGREQNSHMVYLIDFGISKIYKDSQNRHIPFKQKKPFIGTTRYASIAAHQGYELGRKDDLESLGYIVVFLLKGHLPWQNLQNVPDRDKTEIVGEIKQKTKIQDLCKDLPQEFVKYFDYVRQLSFKTTPDYKYLKNLFLKLGNQYKVKYFTNDFDWNQNELGSQHSKRDNRQSVGSGLHGQSLLIPPNQRQKQRSGSLTPSQRSSNSSRRTSNASYLTAMSQNSVYIKYQPHGSMYKPNSSMNFEDDIFNNRSGSNLNNLSYQQAQHNQRRGSRRQSRRNSHLNNDYISNNHINNNISNIIEPIVIKEEAKSGDIQSSVYCNLEMDEMEQNTNLEKKYKKLQVNGVVTKGFIKNKQIKQNNGIQIQYNNKQQYKN